MEFIFVSDNLQDIIKSFAEGVDEIMDNDISGITFDDIRL